MALHAAIMADFKKTGKFTDAELKIIADRWDEFVQDFYFNRCTTAQMIKQARIVLACDKAYPKA